MKEPDWDKKDLTMGELYDPAMKVQSTNEAAKYFSNLIRYMMRFYPKDEKTGVVRTREEHIQIQKGNLGYYAGYYDGETSARVQRFFNCVHPIFGATAPSPEEAFRAGQAAGEATKRGGKIKTVNQPATGPHEPRHTIILD